MAQGKWRVASDEWRETKEKSDERFLSPQADTFAGANVKEKASGCCVRNGAGGKRVKGRAGAGGSILRRRSGSRGRV
jgi:hypothetical protein